MQSQDHPLTLQTEISGVTFGESGKQSRQDFFVLFSIFLNFLLDFQGEKGRCTNEYITNFRLTTRVVVSRGESVLFQANGTPSVTLALSAFTTTTKLVIKKKHVLSFPAP